MPTGRTNRIVVACLVGAAVGLGAGAEIGAAFLFAATPAIAFQHGRPSFVRLRFEHASLAPGVDVEALLRPEAGAEEYAGTASLRVAQGTELEERRERRVRVPVREVDRLAGVLKSLRLSRQPYEPDWARTDDYPRHLLEFTTDDGAVRLEMHSQDRSEWMAIVSPMDTGWRLYSIQSLALATEFERFRNVLVGPDLEEMLATCRRRINEKLTAGETFFLR